MAAFYWNRECVGSTYTSANTNTLPVGKRQTNEINIPPPYFYSITEQVHTPSSKLSETSRCWDLNQYVALLYVNNQNFRFFDFLFKFCSNFSKNKIFKIKARIIFEKIRNKNTDKKVDKKRSKWNTNQPLRWAWECVFKFNKLSSR